MKLKFDHDMPSFAGTLGVTPARTMEIGALTQKLAAAQFQEAQELDLSRLLEDALEGCHTDGEALLTAYNIGCAVGQMDAISNMTQRPKRSAPAPAQVH